MKSDVTEPINKNDTPKPDKARLMTRLFLDFTKSIIFFVKFVVMKFQGRSIKIVNNEFLRIPKQIAAKFKKQKFFKCVFHDNQNCTLL